MENEDNLKKILESLLTIIEIVIDGKDKIDTITLETNNLITNCLNQTKKILLLLITDSNYHQEMEKLIKIIDKELEYQQYDDYHQMKNTIRERIQNLETKQRNAPTIVRNALKINEKYPENWSKNSTIDLDSVVNLPPVPEDVFTNFDKPTNHLKGTMSLTSLKNIRRVKLSLQKVVDKKTTL